MSQEHPEPDDACEVCGERRDHHGDMHHKFSYDGVLEQLPPPAPPKALPPKQRGGQDPQERAFLRLIEVMGQKGLLDGVDLLYIFAGVRSAPDRGEAEAPTAGTGDSSGT